jgi:hypothetical protein
VFGRLELRTILEEVCTFPFRSLTIFRQIRQATEQISSLSLSLYQQHYSDVALFYAVVKRGHRTKSEKIEGKDTIIQKNYVNFLLRGFALREFFWGTC